MGIYWKTDFDICAAVILIAFLAVYKRKKKIPGMLSMMYEIMAGVLILCSVIEFFVIKVEFDWADAPLWSLYILTVAYQIIIVVLVCTFNIFIFLVARKGRYTQKRWYWYVCFSPAVALLLLILTTPYTGLLFSFNENKLFHQGPLYFVTYILSGIYLIASTLITLYYRKSVPRKDRISLFVLIGGVTGGMLIQALQPRLLVVNFCSSVFMIMLYFSQSYGGDDIDTYTNLFNREALMLRINTMRNNRNDFSLLAVTPDDFEGFMRKNGGTVTDFAIKNLADELCDRFGSGNVYFLGNARFALIGKCGHFEELTGRAQDVMRKEHTIREMNYSFELTGCYLESTSKSFPEDEIIERIERGVDIAVKSGRGLVLTEENFDVVRDSLVFRMEEERKELEKQKEEAEHARDIAEKADRAKSVFLAHMSHEIRTPLTTILGMTEILLRGDLTSSARTSCESIFNAGRSLLQIINDILDFSKIEAGKMEIVEEPYNIASTFDSVINVLKMRCVSRPISIYVNIDPEIPAVLKGDENRIKQIFSNFLSNAAKYTDSGSITLTVGWDKAESSLIADITDTGRGIKKEDMEKLFVSFNRLDTHANKAIEGTGLGLTITRRLIELMGGTIHVESEYGKGSTFGFRIKQEVVRDIPVARIEDRENKRVFVCIEDTQSRNRVEGILKSLRASFTLSESLKPLHEENDFTHVLLDSDAYMKYSQDIQIVNRKKLVVLRLPWETELETSAGDNFVLIHYPVSSISIANAFINESVVSRFRGSSMRYFVAPEARILVVDDNSFNRTIAEELLVPHKFMIDLAESGQECIELFKKTDYDLVFLDHMMPGMDGIETLKIIMELDKYKEKKVPFIAFTANAVSGMKEEFKKSGFNDFLSKPINIDRLESILVAYLPEEKLHTVEKEEFEAMNSKEEKVAEFDVSRLSMELVNIPKGLENVGNDVEKYFKLLKVIIREGEMVIGSLSDYLDHKDIENYTISVHAVKSSMASIGAMSVSAKARALEAAGREDNFEYISENHEELIVLYRVVLKNLEKAVNAYEDFSRANKPKGAERLISELARSMPDQEGCVTCIKLLMNEYEYESAIQLSSLFARLAVDEGQKEFFEKICDEFAVFNYDGVNALLSSEPG